jgi:hypothetical protein
MPGHDACVPARAVHQANGVERLIDPSRAEIRQEFLEFNGKHIGLVEKHRVACVFHNRAMYCERPAVSAGCILDASCMPPMILGADR